ncbi:hypothetical protein [Methylobacterium oxalidis]|uniref:hypothetical protein n=1 Tax=Methylobacterium oxalidis TaxID=944322 RepID=UPI0011BE57B7|nr:hypothetical protein [Methylobacterium oxalidis]
MSLVLSDDLLDAIEYLRRISTDPVIPSRSQVVRDLLSIALARILFDGPDELVADFDAPFLKPVMGR